MPFLWLPHDHFHRSFWRVDSLFRKKQAPIADENPMALRMAKTALIALLLLLNWNKLGKTSPMSF